MSNGRSRSRTGVHAAIATIAIAAGLGVVGVAGADEAADATIYMSEQGSWCFTTDSGRSCDAPHAPAEVTIDVGDTVTWDFPGGPYAAPHNATSATAGWTFSTGAPANPHVPNPASFTFTQPGDYEFVCGLHSNMRGTIHVNGQTATPTPTPTPTVIPQPGGGGHVDTPAPSGDSDDTVKPTVRGVRLKARRRAVRVRFRLSEPATVTIRVKRRGSRKVLKSARVQAPAGTRKVTLRSKRLKKGRYTVQIRARDAFGNLSRRTTKRLTLRR